MYKMSAHDNSLEIEGYLESLRRELEILEQGLQIARSGKDINNIMFKTFADQMTQIDNYEEQLNRIHREIRQINQAEARRQMFRSSAAGNIYCVNF